MTPYRSVLCPVDFSDISRMALEWSLGLAKELEAELTVLHVADTGLTSVGNLVSIPENVSELRRHAEERLADWRGTLDLASAHLAIEPGVPANVIVETAEKDGCGLARDGDAWALGASETAFGLGDGESPPPRLCPASFVLSEVARACLNKDDLGGC